MGVIPTHKQKLSLVEFLQSAPKMASSIIGFWVEELWNQAIDAGLQVGKCYEKKDLKVPSIVLTCSTKDEDLGKSTEWKRKRAMEQSKIASIDLAPPSPSTKTDVDIPICSEAPEQPLDTSPIDRGWRGRGERKYIPPTTEQSSGALGASTEDRPPTKSPQARLQTPSTRPRAVDYFDEVSPRVSEVESPEMAATVVRADRRRTRSQAGRSVTPIIFPKRQRILDSGENERSEAATQPSPWRKSPRLARSRSPPPLLSSRPTFAEVTSRSSRAMGARSPPPSSSRSTFAEVTSRSSRAMDDVCSRSAVRKDQSKLEPESESFDGSFRTAELRSRRTDEVDRRGWGGVDEEEEGGGGDDGGRGVQWGGWC